MIPIVFSGGGPLPHTTGIVWPVFRQIGHISWNRVLSSRILTAKVSAYGARPLPCPHPPGRFPPRSTARGERENGVFSCVQPLALPHERSTPLHDLPRDPRQNPQNKIQWSISGGFHLIFADPDVERQPRRATVEEEVHVLTRASQTSA